MSLENEKWLAKKRHTEQLAVQHDKDSKAAGRKACFTLLIVIVVVGFLCYLFSDGDTGSSGTGIATNLPAEHFESQAVDSVAIKKKARTDSLNNGFDHTDGSNIGLVKYVKDNLNDANSFEHVSTKYWDDGSYLRINMKYRAKNGYGAYMLSFIKADVDLAGNVIKVVQVD